VKKKGEALPVWLAPQACICPKAGLQQKDKLCCSSALKAPFANKKSRPGRGRLFYSLCSG